MNTTQQIITIARRLVAQGQTLETALAQSMAEQPRSNSGARSVVDRALLLERQGQRVADAWAGATRGRAPALVRMAARIYASMGRKGLRGKQVKRAHDQPRGGQGRFADSLQIPVDGSTDAATF
jgi:hypothetical protein